MHSAQILRPPSVIRLLNWASVAPLLAEYGRQPVLNAVRYLLDQLRQSTQASSPDLEEDALSDFHARFADEMGPQASRARRMCLAKPAPALSTLTEDLQSKGPNMRNGPWLHLPDQPVSLTLEEETLYERIRPFLLESSCGRL